MRRLALQLAPSRAALWSRRLAFFAAATALIGVLLGRSGAIEMTAALAVIGAALMIALLAVILAFAAFAVIWDDGRPGAGAALGAFVLALLLLTGPAYMAAQAYQLPRLNDVTTDIADPPRFSLSQRALEMRAGRVPPDVGPEIRALQQQAYPFLAPIILDIEPENALPLALKAAANRGWQVIETAPIGGRNRIGHIEALDRTPLMRFTDDITVRIRPQGAGSRIDLRSASRLGSHDFGANARRIRGFAEELSALAGAIPAPEETQR